MKITVHSKIKLHPLEIRKEKKNYIIEDLTTSEFYEMPEICVVAIRKILDGIGLEEIERDLKWQFPKEEVDLQEFAEQLLDLDLVEEVDGEKIETSGNKKEKVKSGFTWISTKFASLFFNKFTKIGYSVLFVLNISLFVFNPHLFPHYKDVFIFDLMFQNTLIWIVIGVSLALFHEFGHILAIRAHGLPTKLEVGHRLFLVVLETDLSLAWKISAKDRIHVYLSGLSFDNLVLFLALLTQILFPNSSDLFLKIIAFIVLDVVVRVIYQCCVYMKTDLYYVLENLTGCHNLMENAMAIFFKRKQELSIFEGEKRTIYGYTVFYIFGIAVSIVLFTFYYIPQIVYTLIKVTPGLIEPIFSVPFLDGLFVLLQVILLFGFLIYSWSKGLKSRKQLN
jgi:putative peptide zinc metalloprotease protein